MAWEIIGFATVCLVAMTFTGAYLFCAPFAYSKYNIGGVPIKVSFKVFYTFLGVGLFGVWFFIATNAPFTISFASTR